MALMLATATGSLSGQRKDFQTWYEAEVDKGLKNGIDLSAEFEQLFVNQKLGIYKSNYNYPSLYLGIAYRVGFFAAGMRYDVLYDDYKSIYTSPFSPIVRFYF